MSLKKYIGDRAFYRRVLAVAVPMMIQNGITNLVNLLDNIMVGRLGTEPMSGVSIVNQFIFIFSLLIFGAVSAAGIFTAQYHGNKDTDGERNTFRFKLLINLIAAILACAVFAAFKETLISLFLHTGSTEGDLALTLNYGKQYLMIMLFGLLPYAIAQVYASTMRETEQTIVPMVASLVAVGVNFVLNLILIFGVSGIIPPLGVRGAAIATVISRFAELAVLVVWGHTHKTQCPYLVGAYRSLRVPRPLFWRIIAKGLPLMANEVLWAMAITLRNQCYSTRGLDIVASQNICSTIVNVFSVVYMAIGSSIAIIVGNLLGAGRFEEAKDADRKMLAFSVTCSAGIGLLMAVSAPFFPMLYKTGADVRALATYMMIVSAATMPFCAYAHSAYFTLRSGGQVMVTILFDSAYMWCLVIPVSASLAYLTPMSIHVLFAICQGTEIVKVLFGYLLLRRGTWVRRLVTDR